MIRKPVSGAVVGNVLVVICDDGSLWEWSGDGAACDHRPPAPGSMTP